ncbi:MAG: hypothetical protein BWX97_00296 [Firmicutes bacterium ADurb.Bin146]|nr:MAG: hypothetical protein BWX97_00296 [Firmicutes bacterium ADurb.Bin146]
MKYLEYRLFSKGYINRFLTAGIFCKENPFSKTVLNGKVNEWLINNPSIHDNPCRKEVVQERIGNVPPYLDLSCLFPKDEIEVFEQNKQLKIYFPFGNTGIDDSGFYTNPMYLRSYGCTYLDVPKEETAYFEISTCGALTVWLNDELVKDYVPFKRNSEQYTVITMNLHKGMNKLVVCLEDLAERDTAFFYKVRYLGNQDIRIRIQVKEETDTELVMKAEDSLSRIYFDKEVYLSEAVFLKLESFADVPVKMTLTADRNLEPKQYLIQPGQKGLTLFNADEIPSSFYYFKLEVVVSEINISNVIGTHSVNKKLLEYHEDTYEERKQRIRQIICNADKKSDYRAVIMLHEGETPDNLEDILSNHLEWVNEKRDCSDFHLIIMVYMYVRFKDQFTDKLRQEVEDAMAGYRYWIDEPGDDVMWFFSENHALMFHICQYFAGKSLPERIFTCSGLTGKEACKKAEKLLDIWFDNFFSEFTTEWNSSTYLPIDIMGLAYLYNLTPKGSSLHEKARKALDMLSFFLAVNEHKGNIMTSFGRTYERELKGSYSTGMPSLLYLFYNAGYMNEHFRALVPIVVGDYKPPKEYERYVRLSEDEELIYQNTQGINQLVNLYLYKNSNALLSTAVGLKPYSPGYQENVVQATLDGTAQVFINHPGEIKIYGNGRPGFWAGNGCLPLAVQHRNISLIEYNIEDKKLLDYTHAYIPLSEFHSYRISNNAIALEKDGGYIGIRALNGLRMQDTGPCCKREFISPGYDNLWVLKVGVYGEYQDVDQLLREMEQLEIIAEDKGKITVTNGYERYEIKNGALYVNGEKAHNYPLDIAGKLEIVSSKKS